MITPLPPPFRRHDITLLADDIFAMPLPLRASAYMRVEAHDKRVWRGALMRVMLQWRRAARFCYARMAR